MRGVCLSACVVLALTYANVNAQWLNYPTPGLPRTADGKPDLSAPAPIRADGTPDLSGIWSADCHPMRRCPPRQPPFFDLARASSTPASPRMTPWAAAIQKQRQARDHVDDPYGYCMPAGVPRVNFVSAPFRIAS